MDEARLRTEIWVHACIRRAGLDGIAVTVVRKGDPTSGSVLVKLNRLEQGCVVLAQTRDRAGRRAWFHGTGALAVEESAADAYIERHVRRDPDLWVIEVEDRRGRLPFDDAVIPS